MNIDLHKLDFTRGATFFVMAFAMIGGPFLFLFEFQQDLFFKLDLLRLLVFCLAVGFPIIAVNIITSMEVNDAEIKSEPRQPNSDGTILRIQGVALGCFFSLFVFYVPCALTFFIELPFRKAAYIALGIECLVLLLFYRAKLEYDKKAIDNKKDKTG